MKVLVNVLNAMEEQSRPLKDPISQKSQAIIAFNAAGTLIATKTQVLDNHENGPTTPSRDALTETAIVAPETAVNTPSSEESLTKHSPGPTPLEDPSKPTTVKPVFSLFLTPEQRKQKLEQAASAAAEAAQARAAIVDISKGSKSRARKVKVKVAPPVSSVSSPSINNSIPLAPKPSHPLVDPNISKTGETHRFFQEIKASSQQQQSAGSPSSPGSESSGTNGSVRKKYDQTRRDPALPQEHLQFHGAETIDVINGVVARLCGLDPSTDQFIFDDFIRTRKSHNRPSPKKRFGWPYLRSTPDLGITAPEFKLKPKGKDCWTHWGENPDQKWRNWSEKSTRLCKPTDQERKLLKAHLNSEEFESCRRLNPDQPLWQQSWATTLLEVSGFSNGKETPTDLKAGALWIEKYRPTEGSEVLGNRPNTEYLTQWLSGLEVSGWTLNPEEQSPPAKKPEVFGSQKRRAVKKAKRRDLDDMDDFIVEDEIFDVYGDPLCYQSDDDDTFFSVPKQISSFTRLSARTSELDPAEARIPPKKFDIRSNTILISGPTGSAKTAAVYACAEESGYEVFEVSAGTRRTGKDVLGLVGEMAENHHVHVVPGKSEHLKDDIQKLLNTQVSETTAASPKSLGIQNFFQKQPLKVTSEDEEMKGASDVEVDIGGDDDYEPSETGSHAKTPSSSRSGSIQPESQSPSAENMAQSSPIQEDTLSDLYSMLTTTSPRQSLILLEEVDIIFEEDKGFWPSIVTLISKSKRPIVMTCNDPSKIPTGTIRFQEHLEFTHPSLPELHHYLTMLCKIEGYICSSEYVTGVIKSCHYDIRRCIMQLQYDAGLIRSRSRSGNINATSKNGGHSISSGPSPNPSQPSSPRKSHHGSSAPPSPSPTGSPLKRKPQRLLRISARGIVPASAPTETPPSGSRSSPLKDLEQLEAHEQYANMCYEGDQLSASKDDTVGQYFPIYKQPTGSDHLILDQEISSLVEEGAESLYKSLSLQSGGASAIVFDDTTVEDDPQHQLSRHFVPNNSHLSKYLKSVKPALEQTVSLQGLRFNLDYTFNNYLPALQSMAYAESISTAVPTGKRLMRSGGHLKRHLMLTDEAYSALLSSRFPLP
ncbi:hypothetical protein BG004_000662 [Podila humilis]|nr:hypothetical protein BG004_000662 [Podila humilis]